MPVTITLGELAVAVRLATDPTTGPHEPYLTELTRQLAVATETVHGYASDDCPDAVLNEAVVRFVGYLQEVAPAPQRVTGAFGFSGAQSLLARWHLPVSETVK